MNEGNETDSIDYPRGMSRGVKNMRQVSEAGGGTIKPRGTYGE